MNSVDGDVFQWREVNLRFFVCETLTPIGKTLEWSTDPMMEFVERCNGLMMRREYRKHKS